MDFQDLGQEQGQGQIQDQGKILGKSQATWIIGLRRFLKKSLTFHFHQLRYELSITMMVLCCLVNIAHLRAMTHWK